MRLVEEGKVGLNDTVAQHVDPILKSGNGTTLLELWNGNQLINTVTIYQMLHMKSGIQDYDDTAMR
jgi:CubicO group peptidase (beta-lactamase class C family)